MSPVSVSVSRPEPYRRECARKSTSKSVRIRSRIFHRLMPIGVCRLWPVSNVENQIVFIYMNYSNGFENLGETLLSPLVMCGPQGLKFATPVELRLPHRAAADDNDWALALQAGSPTKWQKVVLDQQLVDSRASNCVSVMVDHF